MEPDCQLFTSIIENFTKKRFGLDSKPIYDYFELTINRVSKIPTTSSPFSFFHFLRDTIKNCNTRCMQVNRRIGQAFDHRPTTGRKRRAVRNVGRLITRVAGYSFTYRRPYTLAYFKPAIFQHLRYTSTSNLHEPTIPALFRENFRCFYVGGSFSRKPSPSREWLTVLLPRDHNLSNTVTSSQPDSLSLSSPPPLIFSYIYLCSWPADRLGIN